ncbi:hypothetical protein VNO78_18365 [Psophocarpus tetragonolobus]|uniref:SANT domain-containing protein n=1 Tax=Psophocarpus tetragonolobus TaxID=3891 RepID=A0AAN9XLZ3_PSOTE
MSNASSALDYTVYIELIKQNYNDNFMEHASSSPPSSPYISNLVEAPQLIPRVGHEYQVEVPSIIKQSEQLQLLMNPAESEVGHGNSLSFAIGLPISITWIYNEVENGGHERLEYLGDNRGELKSITFQSVITGDSNSSQLGKSKNYALVPGTLSNSWSDSDAKSFLLGLYIFGKNFIQIKRFLDNKGMGEILAFYYGKFYKSDEYCRWSHCRKIKGRKSVIGHKLFAGRRQNELLSRLNPHVSKESKEILLQVSKSYAEGRASLEEYISSLKSNVGLGVLVEAVGIGKEKEDHTILAVEPGKNNRVFSSPTCKAWSSLGPSDIINFLTGLRLSKAKSNDLFWEAVWPRLLARGWHSEQPKTQGYVRSKDYLVFLIPGVKKFSRTELVKGDHYFDSVSDVLSKVAAEPNLLDLEEEAKVDSHNDEEPEKGLNEDDQSDYYHQTYLKYLSSTFNTDHIKFTVIDTSLVHGGKLSDLREFKSVPVHSADKVEVNAAGAHKGAKHMKEANHNNDMSRSIYQKLAVTSIHCEGKLLKVRELKYLPVEEEDASKKITGLLRESKGRSDDDSPRVVEDNMLMYEEKNISNTDNQDNAKKMIESPQNQKTTVPSDNQLKRTIKHKFSRRGRSGHSNHAVLPTKRRRLTACAKADTSHIIENSSANLGSEEVAFSIENVEDPVSCGKKGCIIPSLAEKSVEDNSEESILNEACQWKSVCCDEDEKCESPLPITFNIHQVPWKSENDEMMTMGKEDGQCLKANDECLSTDTQVVVKEPPRTSCDVGSMEQQPSMNSRRQSTRNRPLSLRALESLANEYLHHGQRRQKRKVIQTQNDAFGNCKRPRTRREGKKPPHHHTSNHGTAILAEEKHLKGDCTVKEISEPSD